MQLYESIRTIKESQGAVAAQDAVCAEIKEGKITLDNVSVKGLAQSLLGYQAVELWNEAARMPAISLYKEANGGAGDVSAFSNITGQLLITHLMKSFEIASSPLARAIPVTSSNLLYEKWPQLSNIKEVGEAIGTGMPYPEARFEEQWVTTPNTVKYGQILSISQEEIFFDLTGQMKRKADMLGARIAQGRDDVILGGFTGGASGTTTSTYVYKGTSYYNWYASGDSGPWTNKLAANPLVDYTAIQKAEKLLDMMTDPVTSELLDWGSEDYTLICMPQKKFDARRILNTTAVTTIYPGYTSTSNPAAPGNVQMATANPINVPGLISNDKRLYNKVYTDLAASSSTNAPEHWFYGNLAAACTWMENFPLRSVVAPPQSITQFERDIDIRVKVSYRGAFFFVQPRAMTWNYNS